MSACDGAFVPIRFRLPAISAIGELAASPI